MNKETEDKAKTAVILEQANRLIEKRDAQIQDLTQRNSNLRREIEAIKQNEVHPLERENKTLRQRNRELEKVNGQQAEKLVELLTANGELRDRIKELEKIAKGIYSDMCIAEKLIDKEK